MHCPLRSSVVAQKDLRPLVHHRWPISPIAVKLIDRLEDLLAGRGSKDVRERLQFHIDISEKIIALGLFSVLAGQKLELEKYFGRVELSSVTRLIDTSIVSGLQLFVAEKGLVALLALFTTIWYFLYARAVRNEMDIIVDTFSRFNPPHDWEDIVGKNVIPLLSIGITVTFLALAWFIDNVKIYCLIVLVLNVLDIRGNNVLRQNLVRHFADQRFVPLDSDLHKSFIMRRRAAAEDYWINKPQLERIGIFMIATASAFLVSVSDAAFGVGVWPGFAYLLLAASIMANEAVMYMWRRQRNAVLERIDDDEVRANRERTGERQGGHSQIAPTD